MKTLQHHELFFVEGIEILLQAEAQGRTNRRFERLTKVVRFRDQAIIEELIFNTSRGGSIIRISNNGRCSPKNEKFLSDLVKYPKVTEKQKENI